jgi:hypothetical protein
MAFIRHEFLAQERKKTGLATPVYAGNANFITTLNGQIDATKKLVFTATDGKIGEFKHLEKIEPEKQRE